jgi:hypothetical protein
MHYVIRFQPPRQADPTEFIPCLPIASNLHMTRRIVVLALW